MPLLSDPGYLFPRIFQLIFIGVLLAWIASLGWFEREGADASALSFNWHPLLESIAFPLLMADALMAYKLEREHFMSHASAKALHGILHGGALAAAVAGVVAIVINHEQKGVPPLYSAHSWMGIATLVMLLSQIVVALFLFVGPLTSTAARKQALPMHRALGLGTFAFGIATMLMGFTEKQNFLSCRNGSKYCYVKMLAGTGAVLLALVAFAVGYLVLTDREKQQALEDEEGDNEDTADSTRSPLL